MAIQTPQTLIPKPNHLFKPLHLTPHINLTHRLALAPLTRLRATASRIPTPLMTTYYAQRSSTPGTLLITEGVIISPTHSGSFPCAPGIWSPSQIVAWKPVTAAVHAKGCFIFVQLFGFGRAADPKTCEEEGIEFIAPSAIPMLEGGKVPRAMTPQEIRELKGEFVAAARNAMEAGFDGVEIHGANGYLLDQFLQSSSNVRTDMYGGSAENRSRLLVEIVEEVGKEIGFEKVGVRLSPWSRFQGIGMSRTETIKQFSDVVRKLAGLEGIAYLHLIESRILGSETVVGYDTSEETLDFIFDLWPETGTLLVAGGYTAETARELVERWPEKRIVVVFGRAFLANPDFVERVRLGRELNKHNRSTFYIEGEKGYTDYPFWGKEVGGKDANGE